MSVTTCDPFEAIRIAVSSIRRHSDGSITISDGASAALDAAFREHVWPTTSPTPAPSEGPPKFTIEVSKICGVTQWAIKVDGKLRSFGPASTGTFMARGIEDVANWAIQSAHSSALASREVADLVKAARDASNAIPCTSPWCGIDGRGKCINCHTNAALRTAIAPFAGGEP